MTIYIGDTIVGMRVVKMRCSYVKSKPCVGQPEKCSAELRKVNEGLFKSAIQPINGGAIAARNRAPPRVR